MTSTTMNTQEAAKPPASKVWMGILGALVLLGLCYFIISLIIGDEWYGINDSAPWGIFIVGMILLLGISIGSTVVGALINAFGKDELAPLAMRALIVGLVTLAGATLFVAADVGNIFRTVLVPFIWQNPSSMFFWTSLTYYIFGILLIVSLVYTARVAKGDADEKDKKRVKTLSIITALFAILLVAGIDGSLFAVNRTREFWNHASLPVHFADVSILSGVAVMLLIGIGLSKSGRGELVSKKALKTLAYILLATLTIAAFFDVYEALVMRYSDTMSSDQAWKLIWGGNLPLTILHIGGYLVAFLILITQKGREETSKMKVAAIATLVGVVAWRYTFVTTGLFIPLLPFLRGDTYVPTWPEFVIVAGIFAAVLLGYQILVRSLPTEEDSARPAPSPPPA